MPTTQFSLRGVKRFVAILVLLQLQDISYSQLIATVAGNGTSVNSGDGNQATCAGIRNPKSVYVDGSGNQYITAQHCLRKVEAGTGIITTLAGQDLAGSAGDGGLAISASLNDPYGICLDAAGNIYISEMQGHRIRKIERNTGIISTVAGTGTAGYNGDNINATTAQLSSPYGIQCDANNNLYLADMGNNRIRRIQLSTSIITTIAGNGSNTFSGDAGPATAAGVASPTSLCTGSGGIIYFAEGSASNRIRQISATGIISTIAGTGTAGYAGDGGPATDAQLSMPAGIANSTPNGLYISDNGNSRIRKINLTSGIISTFAGSGVTNSSGDYGPAIQAGLSTIGGICSENGGNLYIAEQTGKIRKVYVNLTSPPPPTTPVISISANTTNACSGTPIIFTATTSNTGPNSFLQWFRNGINVGTNSSTYAPTSLNNGDQISCAVTATTCNGVQVITSNVITITGNVTPSISIAADATTICEGSEISFTATVVNGGTSPGFEWMINGNLVSSQGHGFTTNILQNGDRVSCRLLVDPTFTCVSVNVAVSAEILMNVTPLATPTVNISGPVTAVCPGSNISFQAVAGNAGSLPQFQWRVNGIITGTGSASFSSNQLSAGDEVQCMMVPGAGGCSRAPVLSNVLVPLFHPIPSISLRPKDTAVFNNSVITLNAAVNGDYNSVEWVPATLVTNSISLSTNTIPVTNEMIVAFVVTTTGGCKVTDTAKISLFNNLYVPSAFSPNGDGLNDIFRIPPGVALELKRFSVYDRWGNNVFTTSDRTRGWDGSIGGKNAPAGVYVYYIVGTENGKPVQRKGTVTLIK